MRGNVLSVNQPFKSIDLAIIPDCPIVTLGKQLRSVIYRIMTNPYAVLRAISIYSGLALLGFLVAVGLSLAVQRSQLPPVTTTAAVQPTTDPFREGVSKAMAAAEQTQTAKTVAEWDGVATLWEGAIAAMQSVPTTHEQYATAQQKAIEYQKNLDYARRNGTPPSDTSSPAAQPSATEASNLSQKAAQIQIGMSYNEVVELLGRRPDTFADDQIRQELGRPVSGVSLISFDWENDDTNCYPVSVEFDPETMTVTGWDEGKACFGPGPDNEPFGKPCDATLMCRLR